MEPMACLRTCARMHRKKGLCVGPLVARGRNWESNPDPPTLWHDTTYVTQLKIRSTCCNRVFEHLSCEQSLTKLRHVRTRGGRGQMKNARAENGARKQGQETGSECKGRKPGQMR